MNPVEVLVRPIVSEKSNGLRESAGQYTFEVSLAANKTDVKRAVEGFFDTKVAAVRTVVCRGKVKRKGMHVTKLKTTKKALVTLVEGQKIKLFEDQ